MVIVKVLLTRVEECGWRDDSVVKALAALAADLSLGLSTPLAA